MSPDAGQGELPRGDETHLSHPLLAEGVLERRRYQRELADAATGGHTLVCLPTGLGKTAVSLVVTARRLHEVGGRALLLAPTKPLVEQHAGFYREALAVDDDEVVVFTGEVSPDDRAALWDGARVVVATPQVVENDLVGGRISLSEVVHCTFDECHRATGDYAYVYIAERYHGDAEEPLVTGMSASPGGDREAIRTVCENLGVGNVEVMTEDDADVAEYTHETDVTWETVDLPDAVVEIRERLNDVVADRLERLRELGVTRKSSPDLSQSDLNEIRGKLQELIDNDQSEGYTGMSLHAEVMKLRQAVTLVETQSVEAVQRYFERQRQAARSSGASKADQRLVSEPKVKEAISLAREYDGLHPKYSRTRRLVAETLGIEGGDRVIVFTESRDTAEALTEFLDAHFEVARFVGQSDTDGSDGMSQAQQRDTLDAFREGEFEVLVSTSVAEEGLDVPEVDLVLFYEPVPTAIRSIQRKGRTGRQTEGRVVVLMAEDTRDEAYFWISRRREREMEDELRELKGMADELVAELAQSGLDEFADAGDGSTTGTTDGDAESTGTTTTTGEADGQPGLGEFADAGDGSTAGTTDGDADADGDDGTDLTDDVTDAGPGETSDGDTADGGEDDTDHGGEDPVVATADGETETVEVVIDQRELDSTIARDLSLRDGVETRLETLAVGDYVLSDRVVVERKTAADFVDSLVEGDRSVFEQVGDMARHYARPVLVVEGGRPRDQRDVHPNAIRGALASLAVDFDASVLYTDDEGDTADLLEVVAEREQTASDRSVSVHGEKGTKTVAEQQEYVVSAIADVGPVTAKALLADLGSVEAVMTADRDRLREVEGVGQVTADRIREVTAATYDPD